MTANRRAFLTRSGYFLGGAAAAVPLSALAGGALNPTAARAQVVDPVGVPGVVGINPDPNQMIGDNGGYGPLQESNLGSELYLPAGFTAKKLSVAGSTMSNGREVPGAHDGMACFEMEDGTLRLVRNHETSGGMPFVAEGQPFYGEHRGGCTTVVFDPAGDGEELATHASIAGLIRPCGGGPTPWGSWLAAEETTATSGGLRHGYVWEVPAAADSPVDPIPLKAMGRFNHEAVAVDPVTGFVYQTEDTGSSGIFRFTPHTPGELAEGGDLEMLAIAGRSRYDTRTGQTVGGDGLAVEWVSIDDVDPDDAIWTGTNLYQEGLGKGGATFARGEGAWTGATLDEQGNVTDVKIYWACTSGGDAGEGQIWEFHPATDTLRLLFESPGTHVLGHPDNITVHPTSGIVTLCEDGGGAPAHLFNQNMPAAGVEPYDNAIARRQRVHGVTLDGRIFKFAEQFGSEFAGACWSPDGRWFFVNIQGNGTTYAITGPWEDGAFGG